MTEERRDGRSAKQDSARTRAGYAIDLVSDNASRPTDAMRRFMCRAPVGDEERGEDPTVLALERAVAELTGKDDALFMPSGTMCNVVAYAVHCRPDEEVLVHETSHPVYSGYAGPDVPGRPSLYRMPGARGIVSGAQVAAAILRDEPRRPATRLLSLENTHNRGGGSIWSLPELEEACAAARAHGLATHLDGARLLNAVVATGVSAAAYCAPFDSVWIDLSKGLACPMGAVLAGDAVFIASARRVKYVFGGVMHKAGIAAAAGIYAVRQHVCRLEEDHARARELAAALAEIPGIAIAQERVETNIVYFDIGGTGVRAADVLALVEEQGVRFKPISPTLLRAVTHLDIRAEHVPRAAAVVRAAVDAARGRAAPARAPGSPAGASAARA